MTDTQQTYSDSTRNDKRFQTKYYRKSRISSGVSYLPNSTSQDINLSYQAVGMLSDIFSNSEDWTVIPKYMARVRKHDGIKKIYGIITHLIKEKYAVRLVYRAKLKGGKWGKQYFGYHFFDMPASEKEIEEVQKEFQKENEELEQIYPLKIKDSKKECRNSPLGNHGNCTCGKGLIPQEEEENTNKETTTQPIVHKSEVGSIEPPLLPSSKKRKKKKEPGSDQSSLALFHPNRNYLKGKSESEIRLLYLHFQKKKHSIKDPVAFLTACASKGWYLEHEKNDEYLVENYRFAKKIENNFERLGKNGNYTYFSTHTDGMVFMKAGQEIPLPGYDMKPTRFKEYMEEILIDNNNYSKEIFL